MVWKARFPLLMLDGYLQNGMGMAPPDDAKWMEGKMAEAVTRADGAAGFEFAVLWAMDHRAGLGAKWGRYADGTERQLEGHLDTVVEDREGHGAWWGRLQEKNLNGCWWPKESMEDFSPCRPRRAA